MHRSLLLVTKNSINTVFAWCVLLNPCAQFLYEGATRTKVQKRSESQPVKKKLFSEKLFNELTLQIPTSYVGF